MINFAIVVPARKNSKTLKNKNIYFLKNKHLIEYTFKAVKDLSYSKFVLTDSKKIKNISKRYNFNYDYNRPAKVSKDKTSSVETLLHFNAWLEKNFYKTFDYIVVLQPTSPLRSNVDVINSINLIKKNKFTTLFSVSESLEHPYETINVINKNRWNFNFKKSLKFYRRQDFDLNSYFINGAIYIAKIEYLKKYKRLYSNNHGLYFMKKYNSFDINDLEDINIVKNLI